MNDYIFLTDSSCDLPGDLVDALGIEYLPLSVNIGGDSYHNDLNEREITYQEFFSRLRAGETATTSAVNVDQFLDRMTPWLQAGKDILYIGFSSALSGTFQSGNHAAEELRARYSERRICCVDTLCAALGQGLVVYLAAKERASGKSLEEVYQLALEVSPKVAHWFTVNDLFFLKRGGRLSASTAVMGTMLGIKPILHFEDDGTLKNITKVRGRKASIQALFAQVRDTAVDIENAAVFISHGDCAEDAEKLAGMIRGLGAKEVITGYLGPVTGAHSGPGTMAVFFIATKR